MTAQREPGLEGINLLDLDLWEHGRPHDVWRTLRREAPVFWHEGYAGPPGPDAIARFPGFWNITRYDDIVTISRDPATWISGKGILIGVDPENPHPIFGVGVEMITTDPPRHVRLRRLVNKGFTPRAVERLTPHVRGIVTAILDDLAGRETCDFVTDIAARLPLAVICELMGVPHDDWGLMFDLTNRLLGASDAEYRAEGESPLETIVGAQRRMFGYFTEMMAARRAEGREDLMSVLLGADVDGDRLTDEEILFFCRLLIIAGNETTRNATSGGMLALIEHPVQRERLLAQPELLPTAIEEMLRWTSPVMHFARIATRDTEVRGQPIAKGQKVVMWYPSANRDEAVFPDPETFDVGRTPNEHIAFGIGEHFCLGASLARLELHVIFEELLARYPRMELAGPVERLRSNFIGGIKHMPVRLNG